MFITFLLSGEEHESHLSTYKLPRHLMDRGQCGFNKLSYSDDDGRKSNLLSPSCALQLIFQSQLQRMLVANVQNFKNLLTSVASSLSS
jgi:hypothetical protein